MSQIYSTLMLIIRIWSRINVKGLIRIRIKVNGRIRIALKVKSQIRIRIRVMQNRVLILISFVRIRIQTLFTDYSLPSV